MLNKVLMAPTLDSIVMHDTDWTALRIRSMSSGSAADPRLSLPSPKWVNALEL